MSITYRRTRFPWNVTLFLCARLHAPNVNPRKSRSTAPTGLGLTLLAKPRQPKSFAIHCWPQGRYPNRINSIDSIAVVSVLHHQVAPACLALMGQRPLFLRAVELLFPVMHLVRLSTLHIWLLMATVCSEISSALEIRTQQKLYNISKSNQLDELLGSKILGTKSIWFKRVAEPLSWSLFHDAWCIPFLMGYINPWNGLYWPWQGFFRLFQS